MRYTPSFKLDLLLDIRKSYLDKQYLGSSLLLVSKQQETHKYIMAGPQPRTYMGWWGHLGSPKQKGITSYSISPYAQKPLAGSLHNAVFNLSRRFKSQFLYFFIPAGIYWYWWKSANEYNQWLYTKEGREELLRLTN